jgi:hypothetical protein
MEHGSLKSGLLLTTRREVHGNTIYDATSILSVTVYFDAIRYPQSSVHRLQLSASPDIAMSSYFS